MPKNYNAIIMYPNGDIKLQTYSNKDSLSLLLFQNGTAELLTNALLNGDRDMKLNLFNKNNLSGSAESGPSLNKKASALHLALTGINIPLHGNVGITCQRKNGQPRSITEEALKPLLK